MTRPSTGFTSGATLVEHGSQFQLDWADLIQLARNQNLTFSLF